MNRRSSALLLALFLVSACGSEKKVTTTPAAIQEPIEKARIVTLPSSGPVVEMRVSFHGGSIDDPEGKEGASYVTAATMAEGAAGGLSYGDREERLFPMAAEIDVQVEREQVVFAARVHRDHFQAFYPLFRDVLLKPEFRLDDVERIRSRTLSMLTQDLRGADDETLGKEVLQSMLFAGHPYGKPVIGTETGLAALKTEDLRQQRERVFCASRVHVALSGPMDEAAIETLRADLGALPRAQCSEPASLPEAPATNARRILIVDKPEARSTAISLGLAIDVTRAHPDYAALTLAAAYLGQHRTFAGLLMQKMRGERGLNYGDYAYAEHFAQEGGTRFPATNIARRQQYFSIWIRPVPVDKAHFATRMAVRELERVVREGISEEDFRRIQEFTSRYFALFAQTEQQRLGYRLDEIFYGLDQPTLETLCAQIAKLSRDEVNAALKKHVDPKKLQIAMIAPDAEKLRTAIASETPSPITYESEKPKEVLEEDKSIAVFPLAVSREAIAITPVTSVFR